MWSRRRLIAAGAGATAGLWVRPAGAEPERVLEEAVSAYNVVQVTEQGSVRTMYFVQNGVRYIESRWNMDRPKSLDLDYSRTMMAGFLLAPQPKRFMMMGLGGGAISNYLFERFPELEIDAVDIDPEVVRLAHKYFGVPDHPRYRTHVADGRVFIEQARDPWDHIMLDAFRGVFVPFHLKTVEFYSECLARLTPGGVVVANLHNMTRNYPHDRRTLAEVFPHRYTFVSETGNQTTFVASADPERVGPYALRDNARIAQPQFDFDLTGLAARYYLRRDWESDAHVLRDDFPPADLHKAAERHNQTCIRDCKYETK